MKVAERNMTITGWFQIICPQHGMDEKVETAAELLWSLIIILWHTYAIDFSIDYSCIFFFSSAVENIIILHRD